MENPHRPPSRAEAFISKAVVVIAFLALVIILGREFSPIATLITVAATCAVLLVSMMDANSRYVQLHRRYTELQEEQKERRLAQTQHFNLTMDLMVRLLCRTQQYDIQGDRIYILLNDRVIAVKINEELARLCSRPTPLKLDQFIIYSGASLFQAIDRFAHSNHPIEVEWLQQLVDYAKQQPFDVIPAPRHIHYGDVLEVGLRKRLAAFRGQKTDVWGHSIPWHLPADQPSNVDANPVSEKAA
jgi:hypothetical protein